MIPIFVVGGRGLIYDLEAVKELREKYNVCGTLTGILPSVPQQNVFMGLPLELMPEDIEYLVKELRVAYLVDDRELHKEAICCFTRRDEQYVINVREQRKEQQIVAHRDAMWEKKKKSVKARPNIEREEPQEDEEIRKQKYLQSISVSDKAGIMYEIPTCTSREVLRTYKGYDNDQSVGTTQLSSILVPSSRASYNMYRYLRRKGYFLSPGLRFGGQFLAYPGDPLRFHSHHIAIGYQWDQKFNILDIIGGGRLGTAVKKCWAVGARVDKGSTSSSPERSRNMGDEARRQFEDSQYEIFTIEWAGFG